MKDERREGSKFKFRKTKLVLNAMQFEPITRNSTARFLSIIKPDTDPSLIPAADLINHERPPPICDHLCLCVSTEK